MHKIIRHLKRIFDVLIQVDIGTSLLITIISSKHCNKYNMYKNTGKENSMAVKYLLPWRVNRHALVLGMQTNTSLSRNVENISSRIQQIHIKNDPNDCDEQLRGLLRQIISLNGSHILENLYEVDNMVLCFAASIV